MTTEQKIAAAMTRIKQTEEKTARALARIRELELLIKLWSKS